MFGKWKQFLRISSDVSSKLMLMNKEFANTDSSSNGSKYRGSFSIADNISFSKENKKNIIIALAHGFYFNFAFSIIIPTYKEYLDSLNVDKIFYGVLMLMAPLGAIIGYFYENKFFRCSTKIPYIISIGEIIIGNIFYLLAKIDDNIIIFLLLGRFLVGIANLRSHNKMYIINYLSKKDITFYLTLFHGISIIGLSAGFSINIFINENTFSENLFINEKNFSCIIVFILSIIFLLIIILFYSEAHKKSFSKVVVSEKNSNKNDDVLYKEESINSEDDNNNSTIVDVSNDTKMIKDLDKELDKFNKQNKFDDTNLVSSSIYEISGKEKESLSSLMTSFLIYVIIVFSSKFTNESIIIYFGINLEKIDSNFSEHKYIHPSVLSGSFLMVIILELAMKKKVKCTKDKFFLIIILFINLVNSILLLVVSQIYFIILIANSSIAIIVSNLIQKTASHFFFVILPKQYIICGLQGNIIINIFACLARILSCGILILYGLFNKNEIFMEYFEKLYYGAIFLLSLITLILYLKCYKDIRVKAISRIIKNVKDEIVIATEV